MLGALDEKETAAANCLYTICEMLLSEDKNGNPVIGFGVPDDWKDYSFKLAFPVILL